MLERVARRGILTKILSLGLEAVFGRGSRRGGNRRRKGAPTSAAQHASDGSFGDSATIEIDPRTVRGVRLEYAPQKDSEPDAGEIVWTWVPYVENDGRGKDRPVLVIARHTTDRVYAVKLTSKHKQGRDDRVSIGSGAWDARGRTSWVDTDQLYSVHHDGMRREAAALDLDRYTLVAHALQKRFGWRAK